MHRPSKWWWGVLPLAGLWAYTAATHTAPVERDLAQRAGNAVGQFSLDKPAVNISGRDATLSAHAFSPGAIADAATTIGTTAGVRLVNNNAQLVPTAQPYTFGIDKTGNTITLSGNVPRPEVRKSILDAVKAEYPSATVVDNMKYALGAPEGFENAAKFALGQLPGLATGSLAFNDGTLSVNGIAPDRSSLAGLMTNLKSPPQDVALGPVNVQVKSPSMENTASVEPAAGSQNAVFSAVRNSSDKTLTLGGVYQNDQQHQEILAAATRNFASDTVIDHMTQADNAPADTGDVAAHVLSQLSRLGDGSLKIDDKTVNLSGTAIHENAVGSIANAVSALPNGYTGQANISVGEPGAPVDIAGCQSLLTDVTRNSTVQFETGSARIDRDSAGLLDTVAATAQRCPTGKIEIHGYTDSQGSAEANLALSQHRADAVKQHLVNAGIDGSRLTAIGYGQSDPIASNDTQNGRAKNRRIDFHVK